MLNFLLLPASCSDFTVFVFPGYRIRAGSSSPVHRRDADHRLSSDYNHLSRSRGYGGGRDPGRHRDPSPPHARGRVGGRPIGRAFDGPSFGPGHARGEGRNNPNVRPREGDWICPDGLCGNLNFARRDHCNSCNRARPTPAGSPRRAYPSPPPLHAPQRRFPGPPLDHSPERSMNGYNRSPLRGLGRDGPRDYGSAAALPPLRHEGRFPDPSLHRDRLDYIEDPYRGRSKFDRPPPLDWDSRDRVRDVLANERKGFERRPLSPPAARFDRRPLSPPAARFDRRPLSPPAARFDRRPLSPPAARFDRRPLSPPAPLLPSAPHHRGGRWARDVRERSRSPIRGGPPAKDYRRDMFVNRGRDDRRGGVGRGRVGGMY
ncbi:pH-response regulator protein palI/prr-5 isoform X2 [Lotus japonicus]|uniref:pH-response regulator protein palI/prr-5 isoform X2 n=1 Tax=Lotus japonicus TaxID=34305 RepID=UPI00259035C2|nr:pH-response regulator protein palI/prr-5 isoform X2 [Lotus japonicus]